MSCDNHLSNHSKPAVSSCADPSNKIIPAFANNAILTEKALPDSSTTNFSSSPKFSSKHVKQTQRASRTKRFVDHASRICFLQSVAIRSGDREDIQPTWLCERLCPLVFLKYLHCHSFPVDTLRNG